MVIIEKILLIPTIKVTSINIFTEDKNVNPNAGRYASSPTLSRIDIIENQTWVVTIEQTHLEMFF